MSKNWFFTLCLLLLLPLGANAQQNTPKSFKPFELTRNKSLTQPTQFFNGSDPGQSLGHSGFDFLTPQSERYSVQMNEDTVFGDELVMGMKFSDLLSLRLNVLESDQPFSAFYDASITPDQTQGSESDFAGFQFGVSSVVKLGSQWRFGLDMGKGQLNGDAFGLYQDDLNTTRLGLGIRYNQFGATINSDFYSRSSNDVLEQSTMDIKVDWHFTKDGTISFGARKSVNESSGTSVLDQLTGTVPYIKFKHNL